MRAFFSIGLSAMLVLAACGGDDDASGGNDAGGGGADSGRVDSGSEQDSGTEEDDDAGSDMDSGTDEGDAGDTTDSGIDLEDAGSDAGSEPDAYVEPVCAPPGIGAACDAETGECQTGLRCYAGRNGDFCSVDRAPDCGGFAHTVCPASAPYCLRPIGSSLGACATEEEAICICAIASDKIQEGEGTEGCPTL